MTYKDYAKRILRWTHDHFYCGDCIHGGNEEVEGFPSLFNQAMKEVGSDFTFVKFSQDLPKIRMQLDEDLEAALNGDPAANSREEVILAYPGFYAIFVHRVAHILYKNGVKILPRLMSELAHSSTGIDIHPGAKIGRHFFIDHGTGIVIGETAEIGRNVRIYQGVTLGAKSLEHAAELRGKKRHPTIRDNVIIYSGASILGGDTVIGENVTIGSNVFITFSVPANKIVRFERENYSIIDKENRK